MRHDWIFIVCEFAAALAAGWYIGIRAYRRGYEAAKRDNEMVYQQGFTAGELGGITEGYARCIKEHAPAHGPDGRFVSKSHDL